MYVQLLQVGGSSLVRCGRRTSSFGNPLRLQGCGTSANFHCELVQDDVSVQVAY